MQQIIAQGIGFLSLIFVIFSFQQNKHKDILKFQIFSSIGFVIHFFMLNAYLGALMNGIGIFRALVFYHRDKKWASSKIWLAVFIVSYIVAGIVEWKDWFSLLPIIAMIFTTVSFFIHDPKYVRLITLPGSPCWLTYNIVSGSAAGVVTELFVSTSIIVGMFRFDRRKKAQLPLGDTATEEGV